MIELQCSCGQVHLRYRGTPLDHFVCYCRDCQASIAWIEGKGGMSSRSSGGGDQTLMVYSDALEVVAGAEQLGLYSVRERVRTPRVYARCCHTAIASTVTISALFSALKTVCVRDKGTLPPLGEHINVASACPGSGPGDDGLPRYRGLGPVLRSLLWAARPWSGHSGVRWMPWRGRDITRVPRKI